MVIGVQCRVNVQNQNYIWRLCGYLNLAIRVNVLLSDTTVTQYQLYHVYVQIFYSQFIEELLFRIVAKINYSSSTGQLLYLGLFSSLIMGVWHNEDKSMR